MKKNTNQVPFSILTLLCSLLLLLAPAGARAQEGKNSKDVLRVGYSYRFFAALNQEDAKAATKNWIETVLKNKGIQFEISVITIFNSIDEMAKAVEQDQVDILSIHILDYLSLKARGIGISAAITGIRTAEHADELVLIVRQEDRQRALKDFKNKLLIIDESKGLDLPGMWLDTLLLDGDLPQNERLFRSVKKVNKVTQAVMPVFFKQADVCVTSYTAYLTAVELNPQLGKTLAVHTVSPPFVPGVLCFRENYTDPRRELLVQSICELDRSVTGRQILTIFRSDKGIRFEPSHIENVARLVDQYQNLSKEKTAVTANP